MRKHLFAKADCKCLRQATYFKCVFCGALELVGVEEVRRLDKSRAVCLDPRAPAVPGPEAFKASFGATIDCLAPDWETHFAGEPPTDCPGCTTG